MANFNFTHPEPFEFRNPQGWEKSFKRFERFRLASGLNEKEEAMQVNTLVYSMGQEAEEIMSSFGLSEENSKKWEIVTGKLTGYFVPKKNVIFERAKFNSRVQRENENVDTFIMDLYHLAENCNFEGLHDQLIRDRIMVGLGDHKLAERLQLNSELTLEKAMTEARQSEAVKSQQHVVRGLQHIQRTPEAVDVINKRIAGDSSECSRCGMKESHPRSRCPAKDSKVGHWQKKCRANIREVESREHYTEARGYHTDDEAGHSFLGAVATKETKPWTKHLEVHGLDIKFKIDTGADVTCISEKQYNRLHNIKLVKANRNLYSAGNSRMKVIGKFECVLETQDKMCVEEIYVVKGLECALLGRPAISALQIIQVNKHVNVESVSSLHDHVQDRFPNLFNGIGKTEWEHKISLRENASPFSLSTPRRIPIPLMENVKAELNEMEMKGVISKVSEPTEWCSPMVVAPKQNGKIRICVDLSKLNESVKRERYQLPSVDESLAKLSGGKYFSKIDAKHGFWQIGLAEESKHLTTFITPFGRFCFNVVPMGICSAPEFFQKKMSELLEGLPGVICKMDDILIFGSTKQEHDDRLHGVLEKVSGAGITLNKDKCEFGKTSLTFLGHIIGQGTIDADPSKIQAIQEMQKPENVSDVRRFLGMCNQLAKFSSKLADLSKPLRSLLKAGNTSFWGPDQERAFQSIKVELSSPRVLAQYDTNKHTRVSADSSSFGLGAVLRQKHGDTWKPVAFASRCLSETEQRYAQIEKECLALTWACEKFQNFLIGKEFSMESDHKPLIPLLSTKNLTDLSPRLQRFRMRLMRYDFEILYTPGSKLVTADCLSRAPLSSPTDPVSEEMGSEGDAYVQMVISSLPASPNRLEQIRSLYEQDVVCSHLVKFCKQSWPEKSALPDLLLPYWSFRGDITLQEGLLLKDTRLIIPEALQGEILDRIHEGHQGISKCRERAKQSVFWVGLSTALETLVKSCQKCIENSSDQAEPLIPFEFPKRPFQSIATDLFEFKGQTYLLVVDYFSRYIEIAKLSKATSGCVVNHMKSIMARHGIPEVVYSDNGPCYKAAEFRNFAENYGFEHRTSSPTYSQSNGLAERSVRTIKEMLKKADDPYICLLAYRSTALHNGFSPAELLMGRKLRTRVPVARKLLKPKLPDFARVKRSEAAYKNAQKQNFDSRHRVKPSRELRNGESVYIKGLNKHGMVLHKTEYPRSYRVDTDDGILRRNRRHLLPVPQTKNETEKSQTGHEEFRVSVSGECGKVLCKNEESGQLEESPEDHYVTRSGRISKPPERLSY